jgi:hypothetical protein
MEITVKHIAKFPSTDPSRKGGMDTVVFFLIDGKAIDSVTLPGDLNDPKVFEHAIRSEMQRRQAALGHSFKI